MYALIHNNIYLHVYQCAQHILMQKEYLKQSLLKESNLWVCLSNCLLMDQELNLDVTCELSSVIAEPSIFHQNQGWRR